MTRRTSGKSLMQRIETLELAHVDKLLLDIPGQGLLGSGATANRQVDTQVAPPSSPASAAVEVTCQGPFRFDFRKCEARLEDHVDVVRMNREGPSDQLSCQTLKIHFQTVQPEASAADRPHGGTSDLPQRSAESAGAPAQTGQVDAMPKLAIRAIEAMGAIGTPAILRAPSVDAAARGQTMSYDFVTRRIKVEDEQKAWLKYRVQETEAFKLEYFLASDPRRLGRLTAVGPGVFHGTFGKLGEQHLEATWKGVLELYPQDQLHVLSAAEGASIRWDKMGQFSADKLFVWFSEVTVPVAPEDAGQHVAPGGDAVDVSAAQRPAVVAGPDIGHPGQSAGATAKPVATPPASPAEPPVRQEIRPVKMLAEGHVEADSPQFQGSTPRLEIWFDHPTGLPTVPGAPAAGVDAAQGESAPTSSTSTGQGSLQEPTKRWELSGSYVRLRLLMTQPRPAVREATVLGQVRLRR